MKAKPVAIRLSCVAFFLVFFNSLFAQYYDSITFVNAKWERSKIKKGVILHQKHFNTKNLFGSNQYISFVEIRGRQNLFGIAAEPKILKKTSEFAAEKEAILAVNGNFFDTKNGGSVDFTKVNGSIVNVNKTEVNKKLAFHQRAAIVIDNGKLKIKKRDAFANWEENLKEESVMLNGPLLLFNNIQEKLDSSSSFTITRHPRTCVGVTKQARIVMLVADGRNSNAQGLNLFELTKIMRWLGCVSAINFDGGGSSTLWVKDIGVVNHPSDNAKWDHTGERKVANILYLKGKNNY